MATKKNTKTQKALDASKKTASNLRKKVKELEAKATKKRSSSRKRKGRTVKGNTDVIANGAMALVGAIGASYLANKMPIKDERIKAAVPVGIGLAVSMVPQLKKNKFSTAIAAGAITAGGLSVVKRVAPQVPLLAGEEDDYYYMGEPFESLGYDDDYFMSESFETLGSEDMGVPFESLASDGWELPY